MTEVRGKEIPLLVHERVLGVDIKVPQYNQYCEMHGIDNKGGRMEIKITAVGERDWMYHQDRTYIARWARDVLFRIPEQRNSRYVGTDSDSNG